jgi:nucleotide-binding universal stress UspA family protein
MKRVMVPLDGSSFAEGAVGPALELCGRLGAELHLVQVHEFRIPTMYADAWLTVDPDLQTQLRLDEEGYLRDFAARCQERAGVRVQHELLEGQVTDALSRYAEDATIDLIVMTTHGRGGISRAWLGSVADSLIRYSTAPILLLRPSPDGGMVRLDGYVRRLLIPLDGTSLSERILEPALQLARLFNAPTTLLHVAPPPNLGIRMRAPEAAVEAARVEAEQARVYMDDVTTRLRQGGLTAETRIRAHAVAAAAILEEAATVDGTLIAMATHGRSGWARVALGSVADKVLRGAEGPVLLFRPGALRTDAAPAGAGRGAAFETGEPS